MAMRRKDNYYVVTGGPGSGKTTLLQELAGRGYMCVDEVAREIIRKQVAMGGDAVPWGDTLKYTELMLSASIEVFNEHLKREVVRFFDRGIPDSVGYAELIGLDVPLEWKEAATDFKYNRQVFILPPCPEIYHTDGERKQSFEEAVATYSVLRSVYLSLGYELTEVPFMRVAERADFVLRQLLFL